MLDDVDTIVRRVLKFSTGKLHTVLHQPRDFGQEYIGETVLNPFVETT